MNEIIICTGAGLVGFIGGYLIKTQKKAIDIYKDLLAAIKPNDLITTQDTIVKRLKEQKDSEVWLLKSQVFELGIRANNMMNYFEEYYKSTGKPEEFQREPYIRVNFPYSYKVLEEINNGTYEIGGNE